MRRNQRRGLPNPLVGLLLSVVAVVAVALAFRGELPFRDHYTVDAVVPTANNLRSGSAVRVAGVEVGKVTRIEDLGDGSSAARIQLRIEDRGLPLHEDAVVRIRPRIFLEGNFFVDLEPGSPSAPVVEEGHTFPINQAKAPVQIDQVLTSLQADTREDLKLLLRSLSTASAGGGAEGFNASIPFWQEAYRDSALVNDAALGRTERDLSGYVAGAGATAEALDRDPAALKALITDLNATAGAFADEDEALRDTLEELPRTLRAGLPALGALNAAFPPTRRLAMALRPGVRSSGPAIDASLPFLRQARALVSPPEARGLAADLRPAVASLAGLNRAAPPLLRENRALASCQNEVVLPFTSDEIVDETFPATGPIFEDSFKTLPGLAGESRSGDANGQWFRVLISGGNYATPNGVGGVMLSGQPLMGANPPPPKDGRSPLRNDVPCETQEPPDLRSTPTPVAGQRRAQVPAGAQPAYRRIQADAMAWLKVQLDANPLTKAVKVQSEDLPAARVEELAAELRSTARAKARARAAEEER
jgi:phospholipid/cholesterol/gamma-HCH transport system substrate-binding protein